MNRRALTLACAAAALLPIVAAGAVVLYLRAPRTPDIAACIATGRAARIAPDYVDCVIPPNIAPLNFVVKEPGEAYFVRISGDDGDPIDVLDRSGRIVIPIAPWRRLLETNRGRQIAFDVCVKTDDGRWTRFDPLVNTVAAEEIDPCLVYRLIHPIYSLWNEIAIHQRNLENFDETEILSNKAFGGGCVNCHTFLGNRPGRMAINVRAGTPEAPPGGMLLADGGAVEKVVDTRTAFNPIPAIYLAWHPTGRVIAFSTNKIVQGYHSIGENRDVFDHRSDLALYRVDANTVTTDPAISRPDRLETYPAWSHDGKYLYFCSAPRLPIERYREVRYDLMRIEYALDTDTWGKVETVLASADTKKSITHPRVSPDGRFLLFCMCEYGNFSIFQPTSDLYVMDLAAGTHRPLPDFINSAFCESWHSWSSNGRWVVFSSKRRDGLLARPYFTYVDVDGRFHKPIVLPQEDPAFYDGFLKTYNVPELVRGPVQLTERDIVRALYDPQRTVKAKLDPKVTPQKPADAKAADMQYVPGPGG